MSDWIVSGFGASEKAISHVNGWAGAKKVEQVGPAAWLLSGVEDWPSAARRFCAEAMLDANQVGRLDVARGIALDTGALLRAWDLDGLWWKMGIRALGEICERKGCRAVALDPNESIGSWGRASLGPVWEWAKEIPGGGRGWVAGVAKKETETGSAKKIGLPSEWSREDWVESDSSFLAFSSPDILGAWIR